MSRNYTVAVLFDVHGNHFALKAVLKELKIHNPDCYVFGGDIVSGCAQPKECLEEFKKLNALGVLGNTDAKVINKDCNLTSWTNNQLSEDDIQIFKSLPIIQRIQPPGETNKSNDLLIVHSTPRSFNDFLVVDPRIPGPNRSGQKTSNERLEEMLNNEDFNTMLYGHIHYTSKRKFKNKNIISIVPVGLPEDDNHSAGYALAEWKDNTWDITVNRVKYKFENAAEYIEKSNQPHKERFAAMVRRATYLSKTKEWGY